MLQSIATPPLFAIDQSVHPYQKCQAVLVVTGNSSASTFNTAGFYYIRGKKSYSFHS